MNDIEPVSVESNGRILTGVGVTPESLTETIARGSESDPAVQTTDGTSPPASGETPPDLTSPKPPKGRERFSALTHERDEAKAAADAAQRERDDLKTRLEALERGKQTPEPAKVPQSTTPAGKPKLDDFLDKADPYWEGTEELLEWRIAQLKKELVDEQAAKAAEHDAKQALTQVVSSTWNDGAKHYPDFHDKIAASKVIFQDWQQDAFLRSPDAPHVLYALASDDALADKVSKILDPVELGYTLAQIQIPNRAAASLASAAGRSSTAAPPPYQPVGAGSKTSSPPLDELAAKGDYEAYRARRAADRAAARR